MGFPRKVMGTVRARVVCPGIAHSLGLQCSGRRNALGSIGGPRRSAYFSATSRILSKLHNSNSNVQLTYRLPLLQHTHDEDCKSAKCLSVKLRRRQFLIGQRAVKQMMGYFWWAHQQAAEGWSLRAEAEHCGATVFSRETAQ